MQAKVVSMRFIAAQGVFEARVDVERDGRTFRYPCRVEAPESAPRDWVEAAVTRQALRMSDTPRPARTPAGPGVLHRLLGALAGAMPPRTEESEIPVRTTDPVHPRARLR